MNEFFNDENFLIYGNGRINQKNQVNGAINRRDVLHLHLSVLVPSLKGYYLLAKYGEYGNWEYQTSEQQIHLGCTTMHIVLTSGCDWK